MYQVTISGIQKLTLGQALDLRQVASHCFIVTLKMITEAPGAGMFLLTYEVQTYCLLYCLKCEHNG